MAFKIFIMLCLFATGLYLSKHPEEFIPPPVPPMPNNVAEEPDPTDVVFVPVTVVNEPNEKPSNPVRLYPDLPEAHKLQEEAQRQIKEVLLRVQLHLATRQLENFPKTILELQEKFLKLGLTIDQSLIQRHFELLQLQKDLAHSQLLDLQ